MVVSILALLASIALMLTAGAGQASANEQKNFCYGATLKYHMSYCETASYPDMHAVTANSPDGIVCISLVGEYAKCSKKANEGVFFGLRSGESRSGTARIFNPNGFSIKVYGTFWRKSWGQDNLGGKITSEPEIASWGENRLDIFARGAQSGGTIPLWHRWWGGSAWSSWEFMGGNLVGGPGAVSWGPGRIDVAQVEGANKTMNHWYYSGGQWVYDALGGSGFTSDPDIASWGENRLDVFVRGSDGELWTKVWQNGWSGWISLAGVGPKLESGPGAVSWGPGRIDVVARVAGDDIGHWWFDGAWHYNQLSVGWDFTLDPDIASTEPGELFVYARDGQGYIRQLAYNTVGGWEGWALVGGPTTSGPSAIAWNPYRLDVVAAHPADNSVHHWWWID